MSRNILAVSLAVLFVNIQLSSANVAVEVERIIEELKAVDFQATSSQRPYVILRDLVKNIVAKSPAERENFADAFSEKGGVDELIRWMDYVDQQNTNNHSDYQDKSCAAKLMQILFHGTNHPTFCDRMISSGMVEKFLPLVFKDQLFADADFTSDFFLLGLKTLDTLDIGSLAFELHRIMRKLFGDDLSVLQARFQSETSMVHKLLLAVALVQRSFSEFSQAELERMSIDPGILLRIRDDLLARVESLHSDPHYTYDYTLRTNFMGWQIPFSPATLLRYFTPLLLSDSNRVALCDQQTFNYYFIGVDLWARDIIKKDELHGLTMYSLRGLQILCQTCPHFKTYFQEFQTNRECIVKKFAENHKHKW